jgi:hypothetical protein
MELSERCMVHAIAAVAVDIGASMAQLFGPYADTALRAALWLLAATPAAGVVAGYGFARSPFMTGEGVVTEQPIPFSHEHHVGEIGLDCRYCHSSVEVSPTAGVPPTETCMTCHSQLFTQARILAPLRESLALDHPIAWKRVHALPDYVYFDHSIHIAKGVGCTTCHGPIERMPMTRQTQPMTMGWCIDCHRHPEPNLREPKDVFSTSWSPPPDQAQRGLRLLAQYHIDTTHLTDCSVCHR